MTEINETATTMAELSYEEQATIALISLLAKVADGKENMARVGNVIDDLFQILPWRVDPDDVNRVSDQVGTYGISELPGYKMPGGIDAQV